MITVKYIHPTFTIFFCFSNLFSLFFRKSKKTIYSPLSHAVSFVWLVVFVFTTKTKTRAINFNFDDMMVAVVRAGLHNTRDRRRAEGRLIFKCKTLQPRGINIDFNFIWANSPSARFKCCYIWIKWQFKNRKTDAVIIRILTGVSAMLPSSGYTRLNTVRSSFNLAHVIDGILARVQHEIARYGARVRKKKKGGLGRGEAWLAWN